VRQAHRERKKYRGIVWRQKFEEPIHTRRIAVMPELFISSDAEWQYGLTRFSYCRPVLSQPRVDHAHSHSRGNTLRSQIVEHALRPGQDQQRQISCPPLMTANFVRRVMQRSRFCGRTSTARLGNTWTLLGHFQCSWGLNALPLVRHAQSKFRRLML
jgi:hypothetical protein